MVDMTNFQEKYLYYKTSRLKGSTGSLAKDTL